MRSWHSTPYPLPQLDLDLQKALRLEHTKELQSWPCMQEMQALVDEALERGRRRTRKRIRVFVHAFWPLMPARKRKEIKEFETFIHPSKVEQVLRELAQHQKQYLQAIQRGVQAGHQQGQDMLWLVTPIDEQVPKLFEGRQIITDFDYSRRKPAFSGAMTPSGFRRFISQTEGLRPDDELFFYGAECTACLMDAMVQLDFAQAGVALPSSLGSFDNIFRAAKHLYGNGPIQAMRSRVQVAYDYNKGALYQAKHLAPFTTSRTQVFPPTERQKAYGSWFKRTHAQNGETGDSRRC